MSSPTLAALAQLRYPSWGGFLGWRERGAGLDADTRHRMLNSARGGRAADSGPPMPPVGTKWLHTMPAPGNKTCHWACERA